MKNKAPQKSQIWKIGASCFRIVSIEGNKVIARHHEEEGTFPLSSLRPASASEISEYFKRK
jgi:hypothetical protein